MVKKSKGIFIIGAVIIGVSILLIAFLAVLASGVSNSLPKLVFSSRSLEKIYDGTPLVCGDWEFVSGKLENGHQPVVTPGEGRTDAGTSPNYFTVKITDGNGGDVTDKYGIEYRPGELKVIARTVVIRTGGATKEYDGQPLTCETIGITSGELVTGHELDTNVFGERTDAGISDNVFSAAVTDSGGKDVTRNYNIEKDLGKLEVKKRSISITTPHNIKVYDGLPLVCDEWSYASKTEVLEGHDIDVTVSGSQTDYGVSKNAVGEVIITENGKNVTFNYDITYILGDLVVEKRAVTIRSGDGVKIYTGDGVPLKNPEWKVVSQTTFLEGHIPTVIVNGERTEVGENPNTFAEVRVDHGDRDVTFNYDIILQEGDLIVILPPPNPPASPDASGHIDGDGTIGFPPGGIENGSEVAVRVYSDVSGKIYLRYISYGDYTGTGWEQADDYSKLIDSEYSLNYLTGIALKSAGYTSYPVKIDSLCDNYLLPYYLDTYNKNYEVQTSDVVYSGDASSVYSAYYFLFSYVDKGLSKHDLGNYKQLEDEYYRFVKEQYLDNSMPQSTLNYFNEIISKQNFDASSSDIIAKVAGYIKNAAVYDVQYDRALDQTGDIGVNFLSTYKKGVCQHFALAATLLYRALGFPARYTEGYAGETKNKEWVDIYVSQKHAWVEVYLKDIGWVQVDVSGTEQVPSEITGSELKIKPLDLSLKYYNGAVLEAKGDLHQIQGLSELLANGYTYKATVTGKQAVAGIGYSEIKDFTLYDLDGKDVTSKFNIIYGKGKLHLYYWELTVATTSLSKVYDGTPLFSNPDEYNLVGGLSKNHYIASVKFAAQTNAGQSENYCELKIMDENGDEVTDKYKINKNFGILTVTAREIIIQADSLRVNLNELNGLPLTCPFYTLTWDGEGLPLATGDSEIVEIEGSQTNLGKSPNVIVSVKITNESGVDVTSNYSIKCIDGFLDVFRKDAFLV